MNQTLGIYLNMDNAKPYQTILQKVFCKDVKSSALTIDKIEGTIQTGKGTMVSCF